MANILAVDDNLELCKLIQFCGVQRRKALQIILLLFTTLKTTPNPISPERRNAARSTTIIHYSLLFILLPTSNS